MGDGKSGVSEWRTEYGEGRRGLIEGEMDEDPVVEFVRWLGEAKDAGLVEPNAMCLATVGSEDKMPSARFVLLKEVDQRGFVWFTNYQSRKGVQLEGNPRAAIAFWWGALERQVRVEGLVSRISPEESDEYFYSRPRGSRVGAWASDQSREVDSREMLEVRSEELREKYGEEGHIPRPDHWGGYRLVPHLIEFWQGRQSRLHDRIQYLRNQSGGPWTRSRLQP